MPSRLANQWVLITGASSGFGAAAARAFAAQGARLLLGARRTDRLESVATECLKVGAPAALTRSLDVALTPSVNEFARWAGEQIAGNAKPETRNAKLDVLI